MSAESTLATLRQQAGGCTACDLYRNATQTVFGEGSADARLLLVGEQPGDHEDREGHPFVGPAGQLLDRALADAGIDRTDIYVTNAVKHFKWTPRGKRRIHQTPTRAEVLACARWLDAELDTIQPEVVVALGATAAKALLGPKFQVTKARGQFVEWDREPLILATVHPSSILRAQDDDARRVQYDAFVADLRVAATALAPSGS